jgi:PAS domain S-box-containing protein
VSQAYLPLRKLWRDRLAGIPPSRAVAVFGAFLVGSVLIATTATLWYLRVEALSDTERQLSALNLFLAEQMSVALEAIDDLLTTSNERLELLEREAVSESRPVDGEEVRDMFRSVISGIPQVRAIFVSDAAGKLTYDSRVFPVPNVSVADRGYFLAQRDGTAQGLYVSEPLISRVDSLPAFSVSRRRANADGTFNGLIAATVEPRYFQDFYASIDRFYEAVDIARGGAISVHRRDGAQLVRYPPLPAAEGPADVGNFSEILSDGDQGTRWLRDTRNGEWRFASLRDLGRFPVVVGVSVTETAALRGWRRQSAIFGAGGLAGATVIAFLLFGLWRQFLRHEALTEALRGSEQRFRDIAESSSDWIWETGPDMRFSYVSERLYDVTGVRPADVLGRTREDLSGEFIDTAAWREHRKDIAERRPIRDFTYGHRRRDGSLRRFRITGTPMFDESGTFRGYRGTGTDVTAEAEAEERAKLAQERLRDAVEFLPDGFVLYDADDRLVMFNSKYRQIHSRTPESIQIGLRFEDILRATFRSGEGVAPDGDIEAYIKRRLAQHLQDLSPPFEITSEDRILRVAERRTSDGGVVGLHSDVSEAKRREQALMEAKQTAEIANRAKSEFLAKMSHELRTPLNAIIGFAEVIENRVFGQSSPRYNDYAHDIRTSGEHLLAVINDILDMSRIEAGRHDFVEGEVIVGEIITSCLAMVKRRAAYGGVRIVVPETLPELTLRADRRAVMQVLLNLLSNAVKFTPRDGTVMIAIEVTPEAAILGVDDTGVGISEDAMPFVFEPFHRGTAQVSHKAEGTGLGLSISKKLMEQHGGRLELNSQEGSGTRARAIFPSTRILRVTPPEKAQSRPSAQNA